LGFLLHHIILNRTPELQLFHEKLSKFQPRFIAISGKSESIDSRCKLLRTCARQSRESRNAAFGAMDEIPQRPHALLAFALNLPQKYMTCMSYCFCSGVFLA
jgi:hypothetical protein